MFTPLVRVLMGVTGLVMGVFYFIRGSNTAAYLMLLAVALTVWGYFKNGTVYLAWRKVKKEDFTGAEKVLQKTRFPEFLKKEQRGFYHFTKGLIEASRNNSLEARGHFTDAIKFGVRTENNVAIINLNLAEIEVNEGNYLNAKEHLVKAQSLKHSGALEPEINRIADKINSTQ